MDNFTGTFGPGAASWSPETSSANPTDDGSWWFGAQAFLVLVCVPFLWHAFWTQVYFESTDEAVTQAAAHHPELLAASVALVAAIVGVVAQLVLQARTRGRLICLVVTAGVVAAVLGGGAVATRHRLPTQDAIRASVYAIPVVVGATPLPLDAVDLESDPGDPTIVRKWQFGAPFLRSDVAAAGTALYGACAAIHNATSSTSSWREEFAQENDCSYVRTVGNVRLHYSASLTPGALVPGQAQSEAVVVSLLGEIAGPSNS